MRLEYREPVYVGKVRDIYDVTPSHYLFHTTDRISAFDIKMEQTVPGRGKILNDITAFWSKHTSDIVPNHYIRHDGDQMWVQKSQPIKLEFIVRKCILGSFYALHKDKFHEGEMLERPILTPSTKSEDKDILISEEKARQISYHYTAIKPICFELFNRAYDYLWERGIVLADTKFEFGIANKRVTLIDEYLTPDSSRFIRREDYEQGNFVPLDKQILRNYLISIDYKNQERIVLPEELIQEIQTNYQYMKEVICG